MTCKIDISIVGSGRSGPPDYSAEPAMLCVQVYGADGDRTLSYLVRVPDFQLRLQNAGASETDDGLLSHQQLVDVGAYRLLLTAETDESMVTLVETPAPAEEGVENVDRT